MKYVYLSSGLFGAKVLSNLDPKPDLVITQPDRKGGRGLKQIIVTPVKQYCQKNGLIVKGWNPFPDCQMALVADYGVIIPKDLLDRPKYGFFNIHPSLLPKYRGSTPLQSAILNDEKITGVSIIKMDEKVDHGPIVAQEKIAISNSDTYLSLLEKTAHCGALLFAESNRRGLFGPDLAGRLRQQDHSLATYTHKFTKQDGYVPISQLIPYLTPIFKKYNLLHLLPNQAQQPISPKELHSLIRGLSPWPGVWTKAENRVIKIVSNQNSQNIEALEIVIDGKIYL
ncbi:hypothetical protein A2209_04880 [Candidatus Roizmanbacteria bacterium RIFOXYA1_FULL_41_12]|uniref:methionyl-tRNA formyltransferase n=1 Tax=Candidatus Roizmanbacteria bacterium RIFOXYA1_FULL_41_12 TaxID=1802082 RepID=A0A1F7KAV3_9BACT|nr:MAG: hypothetical protein A2209_04880 [Candidatus Roizmanbacteria bacterium RIFOXYA1_FULL_41_12]OGK66743.1 MAG: hypothetical protein A2377_02440 [Candidatus Roizmanbacteria bacterium RIFOXYB1_FULL_41_27]OGK67221.1 MAG: hypothetical protein A2262_03240 [Candidatus Roizmanbacteria bacterium RIFOXYA2_FULL_41_8]OGK70883.1 MAG: hypothetical protein A2403_02270 [Candidatus Roizmanbacteria bacterium RIFOXYC1_FULL_41_16]OGK75138.1 MAG: hypothetical protein A2459_01985 [Candidatus Roizmanbacteria bac